MKKKDEIWYIDRIQQLGTENATLQRQVRELDRALRLYMAGHECFPAHQHLHPRSEKCGTRRLALLTLEEVKTVTNEWLDKVLQGDE